MCRLLKHLILLSCSGKILGIPDSTAFVNWSILVRQLGDPGYTTCRNFCIKKSRRPPSSWTSHSRYVRMHLVVNRWAHVGLGDQRGSTSGVDVWEGRHRRGGGSFEIISLRCPQHGSRSSLGPSVADLEPAADVRSDAGTCAHNVASTVEDKGAARVIRRSRFPEVQPRRKEEAEGTTLPGNGRAQQPQQVCVPE